MIESTRVESGASPVAPSIAGIEARSLDTHAHTVQFYEDDAFFLDELSRFIGGALGAGHAAVVIATEGHRDGLAARLKARGLDVAVAAGEGRYSSLDAAETLPKLLVDGWPDAGRFTDLMGSVISRSMAAAGGEHPRVAVFGELVALLCADGKQDVAIQLEHLWNELARTHPFVLHCAYPVSAFCQAEDDAAIGEICAVHSRVIPAESYLSLTDEAERDRAIALLQQKAQALETEVGQRKNAEATLRRREAELTTKTRQQAVVADLGQRALAEGDLDALMREAVGIVAATLKADFCKVLELLPDGEALRLRAGTGWREGLIGQATVGAGTDSQAGYTLLTDEPVIVADLSTETRFDGPPLLHEHGVVSGLSVIIRGRDKPFGVLGAHTRERRDFTSDDALFLRSVANVLAAAIERQRFEAEVREDRFRALVEHGSDMISLTDATGVRRYASPAYGRVLGYRPEELLGRHVAAIDHPDDAARTREVIANLAQRPGAVERFEARVRHRDGSPRWLEVVAANWLHDPSIEGIVINSRDITERKQADTQLREAEAKYRTLVEQIPAVTYIEELDEAEPTTATQYISPQIEALLGYTPDEWLTDPGLWERIVHPEDRARVLAEDARTEASGAPFRAEYREIARDGREIWVRDEAVLVRDVDGRPLYWQGVVFDITPEKEAEAALVASEARFRSLVEHASDLIAVVDGDGIRRYASPSYEPILGYRPEDLVGQAITEIDHPDDAESDRRFFAELARKPGVTERLEARVRHADGSWRWLELIATNRLDDLCVAGIVVNSRDVTERKRRDEELQQALMAAQAGNQAQRQFLTMMTHELRSPMQAVLGYADLLLAGGDGSLTPEQVADVQTIRRGAERMMTLVTQMLDLSRLEAGRMELSSGPVDLGTIIAQVRQDLAPQAASKGLDLDIALPPDLPAVLGDPVGIHQILLNLAGNAVKFTPAGAVRITASSTDAGVAVAVSDTGIGIAAAALPQIFEEFRQVDSGMTRRHDGAGLGLAIAKVLAEQMGGRIAVESQIGVGSTFTLHLPAA
jgi:PAS domain S-box-containing protein